MTEAETATQSARTQPTAPGYSSRIQDRKARENAIAVQTWLASPLTRLLVTKKKRRAVASLVDHLCERLTPADYRMVAPSVEHLTRTPPVGTRVRLLREDRFLREFAGAVVGSIGTVISQSRLNADDDGVHVDWGNGQTVRANLNELALVR
jgi:hypothetical protein